MKRYLNYFTNIFFALLFPCLAFAQTASDEIEMYDSPEAKSKIFVVVAVLLIIFIGLAIFLISIDRKVKHIEEKKNNP
jgi:hypothetical protein